MLRIFPCACWPCISSLENVYSGLLPIFLLPQYIIFFLLYQHGNPVTHTCVHYFYSYDITYICPFFSWVVGFFAVVCIFYRLSPCQLYHLKLFSPIPQFVFFFFFNGFLPVQKLVSLITSHWFTLVFISVSLGGRLT